MKIKAIIALLAILALTVTCTAFVLAETEVTPDEASVVDNFPIEESETEEPENITNDDYIMNFPIIFIDDIKYDYSDEDCTSEISSYSDISQYVGQEFYYPQYGVNPCGGILSVLYNQRYYVAHGDKTENGCYNNLQFNVMGEIISYFWIDINYSDSFYEETPGDIVYEALGSRFIIRQNSWATNYGSYYVKGILDGNTYSFTVDSVENAKLVINSLKKQ